MGKYIKITPFGLSKLNNSEYSNFMNRFNDLIPIESDRPEEVREPRIKNELGITDEELSQLNANLDILTDLVHQSRISDETAEMKNLNDSRNECIVFITSIITQMKKSPTAKQRSTAQTLYNIIKPYVGIYKSANQQKTAQIKGLLADLAKPSIDEHLTEFGIAEAVKTLESSNELYSYLTTKRTNNKAAVTNGNSIAVRKDMDILYDNITTMAFAINTVSPNNYSRLFVKNINALIDETTALYNQRIAAAKAAKKMIKE